MLNNSHIFEKYFRDLSKDRNYLKIEITQYVISSVRNVLKNFEFFLKNLD
jgi:hypothetical protein